MQEGPGPESGAESPQPERKLRGEDLMYPYVKLKAPSLHRSATSGHRNGAP